MNCFFNKIEYKHSTVNIHFNCAKVKTDRYKLY